MFAGAWLSQLIAVQYYVKPAVNRQPGFCRELVEQKQAFYYSVVLFLQIKLIFLYFKKNKIFIMFPTFSEQIQPI